MPRWLTQTHSATVVIADSQPFLTPPEADAIVSHQRSAVCAVMTADCLPVLLCNRAGTVVAAAHAGWRGLAAGVLKNTVAAMAVPPADILAWLGPAISGQAFEVGEEVKQAFVTHANPGMEADAAFQPLPFPMGKMLRPKWSPTYLADLYRLARLHLAHCGVHACYGGNFCTFTETDRFFSYRRDATTGRMASLIYLL
jgi:YfiH family protein